MLQVVFNNRSQCVVSVSDGRTRRLQGDLTELLHRTARALESLRISVMTVASPRGAGLWCRSRPDDIRHEDCGLADAYEQQICSDSLSQLELRCLRFEQTSAWSSSVSKRIHIVGRKNSGKTGLIVELVSFLTDLGYCVGTIKHTHHCHELDTPGKDSFRHCAAGAKVVGIMSPRMLAVFQPADRPQNTDSSYSTIMAMCKQCDVVLVEGDSQVDAPKIEVWRKVISTLPLAAEDGSIVAVVSDDELELATTRWSRTDIRVLADWILAMIRTWRRERSTADAVMSD